MNFTIRRLIASYRASWRRIRRDFSRSGQQRRQISARRAEVRAERLWNNAALMRGEEERGEARVAGRVSA